MVGPPPPRYTSSVAALVAQAAQTIQASLSKSSRATYYKTLKDYEMFILPSAVNTIPLNVGWVLIYLAHLQRLGYASSTITSKLSYLNYFQKIQGYPDITSHFLVKKFISGVSKMAPSKDTRLPITPSSLSSLIMAVPRLATSKYYTHLYQAMFSVAFFAFLRPGEFTASPNNILFQNVVLSKTSVAIRFHKFKHHTGPPVNIVVNSQTAAPCPVALLSKYMQVRGQATAPLFINPDGSPITYSQASKFLALVQSFTSSTSVYHPHSFRIGAATHAAQQGISEEAIKRMGRWGSTAFNKYIRINTFVV